LSAAAPVFGKLRRDSSLPLYQQIKDGIVAKIRSAEWLPSQRLPSENMLVAELGVSRMTVTRALRELTQQGHLQRVRGVGTFVATPSRRASLIELRNVADEIQARGMEHRAQVLRLEKVHCDTALAVQMEQAPGAPVFHVELVHFQDDVPIQLEDRHVNPVMAPDFLAMDFRSQTPTQYLLGVLRPDETEHVVQAVVPDARSCARLAVPATEPCLRLRRRTWKDGEVVSVASLLYPGSRYDLGARYATDAMRVDSGGLPRHFSTENAYER
jgi:GntR family histidine utilization transcriptional repressor